MSVFDSEAISLILPIAAVACCILWFAVIPFSLSVGILLPIDRVARSTRAPIRFTMLDFLGLVFMVQLPMGLIHSNLSWQESGLVWALDIFGWIATTLVWCTAISTFARAGIDDVYQRGVLVFIALPMAYMGTFAISWLPIVVYHYWSDHDVWRWALLVVLEFALIVAVVFSLIYARRVSASRAREIEQKLFY